MHLLAHEVFGKTGACGVGSIAQSGIDGKIPGDFASLSQQIEGKTATFAGDDKEAAALVALANDDVLQQAKAVGTNVCGEFPDVFLAVGLADVLGVAVELVESDSDDVGVAMAKSPKATGSGKSAGENDRGADKGGQAESFTGKFHGQVSTIPVVMRVSPADHRRTGKERQEGQQAQRMHRAKASARRRSPCQPSARTNDLYRKAETVAGWLRDAGIERDRPRRWPRKIQIAVVAEIN